MGRAIITATRAAGVLTHHAADVALFERVNVMTIQLKVGDTVAYRREFLRSAGFFTGPIPFARGRIIALAPVFEDRAIATVDWGNPEIPAKVLTSNLVRADRIHWERV
jgi:hypothetical protein